MKITALAAACLLAAAFSAQAAQKSPKKPATTPAQTAPQDIDVDALARAKDAGANTGEPAKDGEANSANAAAASDTAAPAQTPDAPAGALHEAVCRNIYGTVPGVQDDQVDKMVDYVTARLKELMSVSYTNLMARDLPLSQRERDEPKVQRALVG